MIIKLAKIICIDSSHLKKDDKSLEKIKKTVEDMESDDKRVKK